MTLAPTKFRQTSMFTPLIGQGGGVEPGNYAQALHALGTAINDIMRAETGTLQNAVSPPPTGTTVVPADFFQSVMNAYGTALNSLITRRTITSVGSVTIGPWVTLTTLSAANWVTNYNTLATLANAIANAIAVAGI
jgi:hypothetical protein